MHTLVAVLILSTSLALPVRADDAEAGTEAGSEARTPEVLLAEAHEAFDALEMERAAAILEPLVASPDVGDDVRGRAWLALGLTRASLLDTDGARAAFTAALAIDASLAPPEGTSPKVAALFERTRTALGIEVARPREQPHGVEPARVETAPVEPRDDEAALDAARAPWMAAGGALLAVGVVAGAGAIIADMTLGSPTAGRTRADYEGVRSAGIAALGTSAALLLSGGVVVGAAFSLVEAP